MRKKDFDKFILGSIISEVKYHIKTSKKDYTSYIQTKRIENIYSLITHIYFIDNFLNPAIGSAPVDKEKEAERIKRKEVRRKLLKKHFTKLNYMEEFRTIRNRLIHLDEYIDQWVVDLKKHKPNTYFYFSHNQSMGKPLNEVINIPGKSPDDIEKLMGPFLNIENNSIKVGGKKVSLEDILKSLMDLEDDLTKVEIKLRK